eukprot:GILK01001726.1.p1 GENE.GILK01001726.1~~GILK01001726.1.p1  ORF type:complete len:514 (+),score=64.66 GILK01001726.1:104-1543(+)
MDPLGVVGSHAGAKVFALTWNLGSSDSLPDEFIPELSKRLTFASGLPASMSIGLPGVVALAFQESKAHQQIMETVVPHFTATLPYTFCGSIDSDTKAFEDVLRALGKGGLLKGQTSLYVFVHSGEPADASDAIRFLCVPGSQGKARIAAGKTRYSEAGNKGAVAMHVTAQFAGMSKKICFVSTHQTYKGDAQSRADGANMILSNKFLKKCHSLVFAGDFNSRFSDVSLEDIGKYVLRASPATLLNFNRRYDELSGQLIHSKRYLHDVNEAMISFPPTYKKATLAECNKLGSLLSERQALPLSDCFAEEAAADAPTQPLCSALCPLGKIFYLGDEGSAKNLPAYTDRILHKGLFTLASDADSYNSIPSIVWSDHSPVYFKGILLIAASTASNHFAVLDTLPAMDALAADDSEAALDAVDQLKTPVKAPVLQPQPAYRRLPKFQYDPSELQTVFETQDDGVGEWTEARTKRHKKHRKAASH